MVGIRWYYSEMGCSNLRLHGIEDAETSAETSEDGSVGNVMMMGVKSCKLKHFDATVFTSVILL